MTPDDAAAVLKFTEDDLKLALTAQQEQIKARLMGVQLPVDLVNEVQIAGILTWLNASFGQRAVDELELMMGSELLARVERDEVHID